jgi:plasmid stabilization system protein ParE
VKFRVFQTDAATADIRTILNWLGTRSPAGADAWYRRWLAVLETLRQSADTFGVAPESGDHPEPLRQVVFRTRRGRPYRALYCVRDFDVFVLHVRRPGQAAIPPRETA